MPENVKKSRLRRARQRAGHAQIAEYVHSLSARHGAPAPRALVAQPAAPAPAPRRVRF